MIIAKLQKSGNAENFPGFFRDSVPPRFGDKFPSTSPP
jgi:hypothetical protein